MRQPLYVPQVRGALDVLADMRLRRVHLAIVLDEFSGTDGLITIEDLVEEIVGEITDEFDPDADHPVRKTEDGHFIVDGAMTIRDINRATDWALPDEHANTVAGLVIHEAQMIPTAGQVFSFHGFRFEVRARQGNRITELKIRPL